MIDTSSEAWRHECEVRHVANLPYDSDRKRYLEGIEKHRGKESAEKLRRDAWALMRAQEAV